MATTKKYPIIGGPLDGEYANYADFQRGWPPRRDGVGGVIDAEPDGEFHLHQSEYAVFNAARRRQEPSMIWLHKGLLRPTVRA